MISSRISLSWVVLFCGLLILACTSPTVTSQVNPGEDGDTNGDTDKDSDADKDNGDKDSDTTTEPTDGDTDTVGPDGDTNDIADGDTEQPPFECNTSGDCRLGQLCLGGVCVSGCLTTRDCPEGQQCRPELDNHGRCVDCTADTDCQEGYRCQDYQCRFHCSQEADCKAFPATPYCQPDLGLCVVCLSDANCSIGYICSDASCVEGCRSDRDCKAPSVCDPQAGAHGGCFACVSDTQCSDGKLCRNHNCVIDCSTVTCTGDKPYCDPQSGTCAACLSKDNCRRGQVCVNRQCLPGCESEGDCADGLHCLAGEPYGKCVACRDNNDCTGGLKCIGETCRSGGCAKDTDCKSGEYCHPTLATCNVLPEKACSVDADCPPITFFSEMCDPLTRTCITSCSGGLGMLACMLAGGSAIVCASNGGCYECTDDSYCGGTACKPFDGTCTVCTSDAQCLNSSWHCNAEKGSCYECLNNSHCTGGKVCNASNVCVECLENADCKQLGKPICGKDQTCIPACQDECVKDKTSCDPDPESTPVGYRTCGDYDNDPCLEFGSVYACPSGQSCSSGSCRCLNPCTENQRRCDATISNQYEVCLQDDYYGCLYWAGYYCSTGYVCRNGSCVANSK